MESGRLGASDGGLLLTGQDMDPAGLFCQDHHHRPYLWRGPVIQCNGSEEDIALHVLPHG
jgi:hypothetical protein